MGRVFRLGFVVSEDELLLGQVSLTSLGLSSASHVVFLQTGRSSDGPESGIAHHIWAGPHNYHQNTEVHLGIEIYPSQKGVKDHTMVMKPIAVYPL